MKKEKILNYLMLVFTFVLIVIAVFFIVLTLNKTKELSYIGKESNSITVTGKGEVYAKPDIAILNLSVVTEKFNVQESLNKNSEKVNNIISFLKNSDIEEKDIKTVNFNIYPRYEYRDSGHYFSGERVLVGYTVNQSLEIKVRNMDAIGSIIEGSVKEGANEFYGINLAIENKEQYIKQAREKAILDAKQKASEISEQLDVKILSIVDYHEDANSFISSPDFAKESSMIDSSPDIQLGENLISLTVHLYYQVK